jgi:hypothetical protein
MIFDLFLHFQQKSGVVQCFSMPKLEKKLTTFLVPPASSASQTALILQETAREQNYPK